MTDEDRSYEVYLENTVGPVKITAYKFSEKNGYLGFWTKENEVVALFSKFRYFKRVA